MKGKNYIYGLMMLAAGWGCTEEFPTGNATDTEGLVLEIGVGNTLATSSMTRGANNTDLKEAYVQTVDVFFLKGETVEHYVPKASVTDGKAVLASGIWKDTYRGTYDVYVLANKHDYDNPATSGTVETDLNWVTTKTQLLALTDTDTNVAKAEGERRGQNNVFTGKTFLMDGSTAGWDADAAEANATISVTVAHAAAKLKVNVSYTDEFLIPGRAITSVSKKLVHYVQDAKAFAEGGSIALVEPQGEAGSDGFSLANFTEGEGVGRKDVLYAYSYPNEWGTDIAERETYFLMNIPYTDSDGEPHQNYYKVPVRISGNTDDLKLNRNTEYTINVTIDRLGNETIDEPKTLKPTFSVAPWKVQNIDVDGDTPNYLVVSEKEIEMHNVADTVVTFFSSSPIKVEVTEAYYVNKNGSEVSVIENGLVSTDYDHGTLTGKITVHSNIPTNVTARYITLRVTNGVSPEQIIHIVQYPLEYIAGVPGVYATHSDLELTGNTYENYKNGTSLSSAPSVSVGPFDSKVYTTAWVDGWFGGSYETGIFYVGTEHSGRNYKLVADGFESSLSNNRMYLVQITSTSGGHTVARPAMEGTGEDIVTQSNDENNRLVSPMFMLASQLGAVQTADWTTAQKHCKEYVEVAQYSDGATKRLADWRLPTFSELQVIAQYQKEQPDVMDEVLGGEYYWSAHTKRCIIRKKSWGSWLDEWETEPSTDRSSCYIRCIRDVTPEDLEEFRAHGIK